MPSGFAPPAAADSHDYSIPCVSDLRVRTMKSSWLLRIPSGAPERGNRLPVGARVGDTK
jgi:hypothetical protein